MSLEDIKALLEEHPKLLAQLPPVPDFGTFDIESVRDSDYFFA